MKVADAPLKVTAVVSVRFIPRMTISAPMPPEGVSVLTNGAAPILSLKTVPLFLVPLSLAVCDFSKLPNIDAPNKTVTRTKSSKIEEVTKFSG